MTTSINLLEDTNKILIWKISILDDPQGPILLKAIRGEKPTVLLFEPFMDFRYSANAIEKILLTRKDDVFGGRVILPKGEIV